MISVPCRAPRRAPSILTLALTLTLTLTLSLIATTAFAQDTTQTDKKGFFVTRYLKRMLADTVNDGRGKLLAYPTLGFAPETSWEFGISAVYLSYAKRDTNNRLSEMTAWSFLTLEKQYGIWLDHALYTDQDNWFFLGRARYQRFPLLYFGTGPHTPEEHTALVDATFLLFKERVLRKIKGSFYTGPEIDFQALTRTDFVPEEDPGSFIFPLGSEGSQNLALGWGILHDNRHNVLNVREGLFSELAFLHSNEAWGSDYTFTSVISDTRIYRPINKKQVFAAQALGWFNFGDVPFNQLALMGGESMMRGYYQGRYRDQNHIAAQVEYRFLPFVDKKPFRRIGGALFLGTGTVYSEDDPLSLKNFRVAGGGGLRILVFPEKDIFTRLEVAFTREGPGFYLFVGEAF